MGSANEEETLTFELNLPGTQRLVIHYNSNISGKLETIKDTLDSGLSHCLSHKHQQPIRNLMDDLKNLQTAWTVYGRFFHVDEITQTCHLRLTEIREVALQLMLANKINSRLKILHLLNPQLSQACAQAQPQLPAPCLLKPPVSPKPVRPAKPPKPSLLKVPADFPRRRSESATLGSAAAADNSTKPSRLAKPHGPVSLSGSESPLPSDSGGSEHSNPDIAEQSLSQLDLRKTFYGEDIIGEASEADSVAATAKESAAAAAQNFLCANALEELIATEKKYIRRMELLYDHYLPRLCSDLPHFTEQLKELFFDFNTFKKLHQELLQDLEQMAKDSNGDINKFRVGHVMGKYGPHLRLYSVYYTKYKLHLNQINDWMKDEVAKAAFQKARNECPDLGDRMLDVTSHMLEPVQRPLRYPMLIGRYLKEISQDHPDRLAAERALANIEKVTNGFNIKVSEVESLQKLLVILREVTFPPELQDEKEKFICSQYMLSTRVLKISSKNRQQIRFLILSSTVLLLCEVNALNWKTVQVAIPVNSSLVLTLDEKLSADYHNCIRLQTQQKTYDISFATLDEFDDWIAAFKRLNVTFGDACPTDERFPWKTFDDQQLGNKQPMKLKDHDVSQCQACTVAFTTFNRRHHCRICGGIFCGNCSKYKCPVAWAESPRRCCFFCKDRLDRRGGASGVLDIRHRELIEKFERHQCKSGGAQIQGYLNVRIDVLSPKLSKSPSFLQEHWAKMWCTADKEVLSIYKMKKDFVPVHKVVLALNLTVETNDDSSEIQLRLKDIEVCRLRMTEDAGLRSAEREASHLHEWISILREVSQMFATC